MDLGPVSVNLLDLLERSEIGVDERLRAGVQYAGNVEDHWSEQQ